MRRRAEITFTSELGADARTIWTRITDPAGIAWEAFHTTGAADDYEASPAAQATAVPAKGKTHCGCGPA